MFKKKVLGTILATIMLAMTIVSAQAVSSIIKEKYVSNCGAIK